MGIVYKQNALKTECIEQKPNFIYNGLSGSLVGSEATTAC